MYNDRGMIKWMPFAALVEHSSYIRDMLYNKNKIEKPLISQDAYDEMNYAFEEAVNYNKEVELTFYKNGYLKSVNGVISKVDNIDKKIVISSQIYLKIDDILDIKVL